MSLSKERLKRHMRHELFGRDPEGITLDELMDLASEHVTNMHAWRGLRSREVRLEGRAETTVTGATWTQATKTISKVGEFADYVFVEGDQYRTGDKRSYNVASRVDDDSITLATELFGNPATTDGSIPIELVELPATIKSLYDVQHSESVTGGVNLVTMRELSRLRTSQVEATGSYWFRAAVNYAGVPKRAVLEIYPKLSAAEPYLFLLLGNLRITAPQNDADVFDVMPYLEPLIVAVARAYAAGYVKDASGILEDRLDVIHRGHIFRGAKNADGLMQPSVGPARGTAVEIARNGRRPSVGSLATPPALPAGSG